MSQDTKVLLNKEILVLRWKKALDVSRHKGLLEQRNISSTVEEGIQCVSRHKGFVEQRNISSTVEEGTQCVSKQRFC